MPTTPSAVISVRPASRQEARELGFGGEVGAVAVHGSRVVVLEDQEAAGPERGNHLGEQGDSLREAFEDEAGMDQVVAAIDGQVRGLVVPNLDVGDGRSVEAPCVDLDDDDGAG